MNDIRTARRLEKALIDDERTHELGVHVHVIEGRVVAQGEVASEDRRQRVLDVLREVAPDVEVSDQLTLSAEPVGEPPASERLRGQGARSAGEHPPEPGAAPPPHG
jgi:osmotically-inducible protein OsmY